MEATKLIDLSSTVLRASWDEEDFQRVMRNERMLASIDAQLRNPALEEITWEQRIYLVYQRRLTIRDDFVGGLPHPRDIDLAPAAYSALVGHIYLMMRDGQVARDPTWQDRYPDLYAYDPNTLPAAN